MSGFPSGFFKKAVMILFYCIVIVNISCSVSNNDDSPKYYSKPVMKDDGWLVASLEDEGVEKTLIEEMLIKAENGDFDKIHGILLVKNGKLILDAFFKKRLTVVDSYVDNNDIELHAMMSVTKSLISLLVGVAIDKSIVNGIYDKVYPYFPEYSGFNNWSNLKSKITIRNFLTMSHGLSWDETSYKYSDPKNTYNMMEKETDWVKFTLDRAIDSIPGEKFAYSTGVSHTTEALISNASGMTFPEFAEKYLFKPLGIKKNKWFKAPNGRADDVYLTGRSMAKFGQLVLDRGKWDGKIVIPEDWIDESTTDYVRVSDEYGYGYFWWKYNFDIKGTVVETTLAWGYGGQFIFIFKDLSTVVCFLSGNYVNDRSMRPFEIVRDYILPAIL